MPIRREISSFHMYGPYSEEAPLLCVEVAYANMGFSNKRKGIDKGSYVQYKYQTTDAGEHFTKMAQVQEASQNS